MSDERDETRQFAASSEAARAEGTPAADETLPSRGAGDTVAGSMPAVRDEPAGARRRPDATVMMPAVTDDWAPSRANPAWSGRAEVRAPLPGRADYREVDDWVAGAPAEPRYRWWTPIVVGIVVLVLLAALGWGIYVIAQNSGGGTPAPTTPISAAPHQAPVNTPSAAPSTEPTTAPTTTSTAEPTAAVTIPALRGLALSNAQDALTRTGLRWRVIEHASDAPAGTVIDSDPAEGQEVPPDTRVTLVVAAQTATTPATTATTTAPTDGSGGDDNGGDNN